MRDPYPAAHGTMQRMRGVMVGLIAAVTLAGCGGGKGDRTFRIMSPGMAPSYARGDVVSVDTHAYDGAGPSRGDVIIFHPPVGAGTQTCGVFGQANYGHPCSKPTGALAMNYYFVKRVVALPGETVAIRKNRAYVNGRLLPESYIQSTSCDSLCNLPKPITVPPGHYFTLGDNRGQSDDSRDWGPVPQRALIGKVVGKE